MSRYIDADILKDLYQPIDGKDYNVNMAIIRANIDDIPTADVQEVRHGKFVGRSEPFDYIVRKCNRCTLYTPVGNFCINCGAKMDGE